MNYFELYPGDYLRDTTRLGLIEHGSYLRLLMAYYAEEQPLPADESELFVIVSAVSAADKAAVRKVAARFFPVGPDGLRRNARADQEIAKAQKRIATARENGAKHKPTSNPPGNPPGIPAGKPEGNPETTQRDTHSGEALHMPHEEQDQKITKTDVLVVPAKAGTLCPQSEIVALYHELLPSLTRVRDWTEARQGYLRKRWNEKPERQTLDWWRKFFGYVAGSDFLMGRKASRGGEPFECDLEWLVRPKNFVKVIEGKYENRGAAA